MANQGALQVDKIIITRQNPEALEPLPPSELEYGELAVDQTGKLYTADKNNNVVVAGGNDQEWSEVDTQTAAEPPNPRQADQLEGYDVQAIVEKAVEAATLIDDLTPPEPEALKDADTLNGIDSSGFATAAQGKKADSAVQSVNGQSGTAVSLPLLKVFVNTITTADIPPSMSTDVIVALPESYTVVKAIVPFSLLPNTSWDSFATVYQVDLQSNTVKLQGHGETQSYNMQYAVFYE